MTKPAYGLDKHAYVGAPKQPTKNILARLEDDRPPRLTPQSHWSFKNKKVRKQEIIDSL